jgi:hypothetical protein
MSDLASYSLQTIGLASLALVYFSKSKKIDSYSLGLVIFWTIGVTYIYAKYRTDQAQFYSNDQAFHLSIIQYYIPTEGINLGSVVSLRYIITLPAYFLSRFGFDVVLLFKFSQLVFALLIFRHAKLILKNYRIVLKRWMVLYFAGPLLVFMSLLALRDVLLAFFTLSFLFPITKKGRCLGILVVALLRPHLAAALLFGFIAEFLYKKAKPRLLVTGHAIALLISYTIGALSFPVGNFILNGNRLKIPSTIFSIEYFSQIGLNLIGLQFLVLDGEDAGVVAASTVFLLFARLVFVDTILTPTVFFYFCTKPSQLVRQETLRISTAMFFFYGLIFQNQIVTNSTRQNLPFITVMGVIAVIRLCDYGAIRSQQYSARKFEVPIA